MNAHGHAQDCDFLGHLPPAASYQLVELDLKTSQPSCDTETLEQFAKQLNAREKARKTRSAKEKKYNDRVERVNDQKFVDMKVQALGENAGIRQRPSQPIIGYLAEEEETKDLTTVARKEPTGFIGLDDDDDHGFDRAFGGFKRKGQGGDSADDRGGGGLSLSDALNARFDKQPNKPQQAASAQ